MSASRFSKQPLSASHCNNAATWFNKWLIDSSMLRQHTDRVWSPPEAHNVSPWGLRGVTSMNSPMPGVSEQEMCIQHTDQWSDHWSLTREKWNKICQHDVTGPLGNLYKLTTRRKWKISHLRDKGATLGTEAVSWLLP